MTGFCVDCGALDKTKRECIEYKEKTIYRYGCDRHGYCVGWIATDRELKEMGCSDWRPQPKYKNVSIFDKQER